MENSGEVNLKDKVLIPISLGMSIRNFVETGIIRELSKKFDVMLLVEEKDSYIISELEKYDLIYSTFKRSFFNKVFFRFGFYFEKLQYYSFFQKHNTKTMRKYISRDKESNFLKYLVLFNLARFIGVFFNKYHFVNFYFKFMLPKKFNKQISESNKILLLSTDLLIDKAVLYQSKKLGIDSYVIPHSWDNLPARGYMSTSCSYMLVWNDVMKKQANELHGIPLERIFEIGIPQYQYYLDLAYNKTKNDFFKYYNVNKSKKTVTYTCNSIRIFPDEELFIDELIKLSKKHDFNLIVRLHPSERVSFYKDRFKNDKLIYLDEPSANFTATSIFDIEKNDNGTLQFVLLMKYSDVIINLASTITIDAIIFNTPIICPSFNLDNNIKGKWNEAKKWYESSHFEDIINYNAVKLANNIEDLENHLESYLMNQELDSSNRTNLANQFCKIDYDVKERILKALNG